MLVTMKFAQRLGFTTEVDEQGDLVLQVPDADAFRALAVEVRGAEKDLQHAH